MSDIATDLTPRSTQLFDAAKQHIPGGVNSPVRAFKAVGGTPRFFDRASGAYMFDADGRRYIDYVLSWGPMLLGHGHEDVLNAIRAQLEKAMTFGTPTELEIKLAD
ncbi:MAG: aminotransferase class III-fold pyridoxal phosphate-dependent enzyme, partial [Porticoccaceae bacterium]